MASRRINSDRFLTDDYTARRYTQAGIDWVENTRFVDVLLRHYPDLGAVAARARKRLQAVVVRGRRERPCLRR